MYLRSKPSSRTALTGEQPDPWDLLQPQDAMSRHRGAKPSRRYELSGSISLLSPEYLLSVERRRFHLQIAGSLSPTFVPARHARLAVKRPFAFTLDARLPTALRAPLGPSVILWEGTAPVKLPTCHGPSSRFRDSTLEYANKQGGISPLAPSDLAARDQRLPPILHSLVAYSITGCSKGSRVFSSTCGHAASSLRPQFRRVPR